jgi:hypothetical protein
MSTVLAFRTPSGGVAISASESKELGVVDVGSFEWIRVVAAFHDTQRFSCVVRLMITEGAVLVAKLGELRPNAQTGVYQVPGTKLTIFADSGITDPGRVEVLVYGSS